MKEYLLGNSLNVTLKGLLVGADDLGAIRFIEVVK